MHFLITAGGTREYIDPVRFICNASSGRMGYALARAALVAGHKVTLVTAPTSLKPPAKAKLVHVESGTEMFAAVKRHFDKCDCLIMAAAVCDYRPVRPARRKIKKGRHLSLELKPTPDILAWAGRHKKKTQVVVGFALEDTVLRANAEKKLAEKNLDMVVANTPAAIGAARADVQIKKKDRDWITVKNATKAAIAKKIINIVEQF